MFTVLVTGGTSGIGLALCQHLYERDEEMHVILTARTAERGTEAVQQIQGSHDGLNRIEYIVMDVSQDESVQRAAKSLQDRSIRLAVIVNNAGTGLSHFQNRDPSPETIFNVNVRGPQRVVDTLSCLLVENGRIVNLGSGAGPRYVATQSKERQRQLCRTDLSRSDLEELCDLGVTPDDPAWKAKRLEPYYGCSKALLHSWTLYWARTLPTISVYSVHPGLVDTALTAGIKSRHKQSPASSISILLYCLFDAPASSSGWLLGPTGKRWPPHYVPNDRDPEYDGALEL